MKNKRKLIVLLGISAIIVCSSLTISSSAATHTHSADCYKPTAHVHNGDKNLGTGCYQGVENKCTTINTLTQYTVDTSSYCSGCSSSQGYPHGYTTYKFTGTCSNCGRVLTGTSTNHYGGLSSTIQVNCNSTYYTTSCTIPEGTIVADAACHTHVGSSSTQGGCYSGEYKSAKCTNTSTTTSGYTFAGNRDGSGSSDVCSYCGLTKGFTNQYYSCNTCGYNLAVTLWTHSCPSQQKYESYVAGLGEHYCYGYELTCTKTEGTYYNSDGTVATLVCNKKINSITPKTNNQTIVR